jgi:hypothetical protein
VAFLIFTPSNNILKKKTPIAFCFVRDELFAIEPRVRPMFGCHAVYAGEKIVLILRDRESHHRDNGVWIATSREHHESLKKVIPSLRSIEVLGGNQQTNWQNIPADASDFEESVLLVCSMILKSDPRIGRTPKPRKKKKI